MNMDAIASILPSPVPLLCVLITAAAVIGALYEMQEAARKAREDNEL